MRRRLRYWRAFESNDGQRAVKHGKADNFRFGDVRAMQLTFRCEKTGAGRLKDSGFLPLARKNVRRFIGLRVDVSRNGDPGGEFPQNRDPAGFLILMEDQEFNARIRTGLPVFVGLQSYVRKHGFIQDSYAKNAMRIEQARAGFRACGGMGVR
jgi:hypothetical protein